MNNEQNLQKEIGQKIKKLRTDKKLSMRELGESLGVSHAHISKLEKGINGPSMDLLEKISDYFNIDISYFFSKEEVFTENESDLMFERDLSIEELKRNYNLEIDGKPATDEEIEEMIKYIKFFRIKKQMESS